MFFHVCCPLKKCNVFANVYWSFLCCIKTKLGVLSIKRQNVESTSSFQNRHQISRIWWFDEDDDLIRFLQNFLQFSSILLKTGRKLKNKFKKTDILAFLQLLLRQWKNVSIAWDVKFLRGFQLCFLFDMWRLSFLSNVSSLGKAPVSIFTTREQAPKTL